MLIRKLAMGMFSNIFSRRKRVVNVLAPVDPVAGTSVVTHSFKAKLRPAQDVPPELRESLLGICREQPAVEACYLLDVLESGTGEMKFVVNLLIDEPEKNMPVVAPLLTQSFAPYPDIVRRGFVGANVFSGLPEVADYRRAS